MKLDDFYRQIVKPTLPWLEDLTGGKVKASHNAFQMVMSIAGQESDWRYRMQVGGPARSYWQFEQGGGVAGVLSHPATRGIIVDACYALDLNCSVISVYEDMAFNDMLACTMARLLLYSDARPLPETIEAGWDYYIANWRPGMPHRSKWDNAWATAKIAIAGVKV